MLGAGFVITSGYESALQELITTLDMFVECIYTLNTEYRSHAPKKADIGLHSLNLNKFDEKNSISTIQTTISTNIVFECILKHLQLKVYNDSVLSTYTKYKLSILSLLQYCQRMHVHNIYLLVLLKNSYYIIRLSSSF